MKLLKITKSVMQKETKLGMTVGQIISILGLLILVIGLYVNVKVDIARLDANYGATDIRLTKLEVSQKDTQDKFDKKLDKIYDVVLDIKKEEK